MSLLNQLRQWRNNQARVEGVETFRVFPNAVLEALVGALPKSKEEMLAIKGIKEAKYRKYGSTILKIIGEYVETGDKDKKNFSSSRNWGLEIGSFDSSSKFLFFHF